MLQVLKVFVVNSNCTTSEKNTVMYVPALPSAGRQTASALQGGRGEPQGTGAGQALCWDSDVRQNLSSLGHCCSCCVGNLCSYTSVISVIKIFNLLFNILFLFLP